MCSKKLVDVIVQERFELSDAVNAEIEKEESNGYVVSKIEDVIVMPGYDPDYDASDEFGGYTRTIHFNKRGNTYS